jgi:hypothetical protein
MMAAPGMQSATISSSRSRYHPAPTGASSSPRTAAKPLAAPSANYLSSSSTDRTDRNGPSSLWRPGTVSGAISLVWVKQ